jgi:GMP synthase (glutamine-hydrolysing)
MVRIYVIDNGGQWTHREWRTLRDLDVETNIVPNITLLKDLEKENIQGLVLSGGAPRIGLDSKLGNCAEYLDNAEFPILGICAGHQFMARHFGGEVKPSKIPEFGQVELTLCNADDPLFKGVVKKSIVWESHNDEVTVLPKDFILLAES